MYFTRKQDIDRYVTSIFCLLWIVVNCLNYFVLNEVSLLIYFRWNVALCQTLRSWVISGLQTMAEVGVQIRNTELNDSSKQSYRVIEHGDMEVEVRANHINGSDGDETHGRCYSCCICCKACCRPCMTKHNPLPASPTRFDSIDFFCICTCYCNVIQLMKWMWKFTLTVQYASCCMLCMHSIVHL